MADPREAMAMELFRRAYQLQMRGQFELAVGLYKRSIELFPTAEAYTFLGWTYRFLGKLEEAIEECKNAILTDPSFGNPYNDIGAYLIELGKLDEAITWLERAIVAKRYEARHYPWLNLGRIYVMQELYGRARECFERALEIEPEYAPAQEALEKVKRLVQ